MDAVYIFIIVGFYVATHWVAWAVSKLGSVE